jgi:hypothetical protein
VVESSEGLGFAHGPLPGIAVEGELGRQSLDGDGRGHTCIGGTVDLADSAFAQLGDNHVWS